MKKWICYLFTIALLLFAFENNVFSQIQVEGANDTWNNTLAHSSSEMSISKRIATEYASNLTNYLLVLPEDLLSFSEKLSHRIVGEYATNLSNYILTVPPCKGDFDLDGDVDGMDIKAFTYLLNKYPLMFFALSFSRENCTE